MKYFGKIQDDKDLVTKEYVDDAIPELSEYTATEIETLWEDADENIS